MPNNWYHETKYGSETWNPKKWITKVNESEKRIAGVGDKVVITKRHYASDFSLGEVFTVSKVKDSYVEAYDCDQGILHWEYEVVTISEEIYQ